jgi:antitoxin component HigA of HigAB toxin-antitoxin module
MQNEMDYISRLKIYMVLNGITQSQLGEKLGNGISQSTVCRILSRKYITEELEQQIKSFIHRVGY